MQCDRVSFIYLREMSIDTIALLSLFFFFFFVYAGGLRLFEKKKERNVITRGNSDMTRDELHLEPSALRIDDRDRTSRHRSAQ